MRAGSLAAPRGRCRTGAPQQNSCYVFFCGSPYALAASFCDRSVALGIPKWGKLAGLRVRANGGELGRARFGPIGR